MTPLILLDVDGVLNRFAARGDRLAPGWVRRSCVVDGQTYPVTLNTRHGAQLLALAEDTGAELVWATTWEHDANRLISPVVGLPTLPVIGVDRDNQMLGSSVPGINRKAPFVADWVGDRPFVWFDDGTSAADQGWLADRCGPCHLVHVDDWYGITDDDLAEAADWLADLAGGDAR